jgi:hypothetical protein
LAHGADLLADVEHPDDAIAVALRLRQLVDGVDALVSSPEGSSRLAGRCSA